MAKTKPKTEFRPIKNSQASAKVASTDTPPRLKIVRDGVEQIIEPATRDEYNAIKRRAKATAESITKAGRYYEVLEERLVPSEPAEDNL